MARTAKRKSQALVVRDNSYPNPKGVPPFADNEQKKRYATLHKEKKFIQTLTPSESALRKFGLFEELQAIFTRSGLSVLLDHSEVPIHFCPTLEFLSSLVVDENDAEEVVGWKFRLAGVQYDFSRHDICERLHLPTDGLLPSYSAEIRDAFWKSISDMDSFCPLMCNRTIKSGLWKYIHQIVAVSIHCRKDRARFVQAPDIDCMIAMANGDVVDWFTIISRRMQVWADTDARNKGFGGGLFVSLLGLSLGIDFSSLRAFAYPLDYKRMVKMQILKDGTWAYNPKITDKSKKTITRRKRIVNGVTEDTHIDGVDADMDTPPTGTVPPPTGTVPPPTDTVPQPAPSVSSLFDLERRISTLEHDFSTFRNGSNSFREWITSSLVGFMEHQGYTSFPPPPSVGSDASTSHHTSPSDEHP